MNGRMVASILVMAFSLLAAIGVLTFELDHAEARIAKLERSCLPTYTGGGVWQCLQPNARQTGSVAR